MDHWKIIASTLGMSLLLALVILGTDSASAVDYSSGRRGSPLASAVGSREGSHGWNEKTLKPPTQPGDTVSARPSVTVTAGAWRNMRPTESTLHGVSLLPPDYSIDCQSPDQLSEGWIVGDGGTILRYCNGVWDHAIFVGSAPTVLLGVQTISPTLSVTVGDQGAILVYLYTQSGDKWQWTKAPAPSSRLLYNVSMQKQNDGSYYGWVVGYGDPAAGGRGTLIRGNISAPFVPFGSPQPTHTYSWENVTGSYSLPAVDSYYAVQTLSPTNSWAVGAAGSDTSGIIIHWNGSQWSVFQTVAEPLYGIRMKSASEGWAVGRGGAIYRYNGSTWSKVASPTTQILTAMAYAPNGEQWIVGYNNALLKYVSGSWMQVPPENLRTDAFDFRAVDFTSGRGWLVGGHFSKGIGGQILEYENGLWLAVTPPTDNRLNAVATVADNDAWAVGAADSSGGTIIHWDGKHWQRWYQPDLPIPAADLFTISMVSATDGWAAGDPLVSGGPALTLHWDGKRWAQPRYSAASTARINSLDTFITNDPFYPVFAWAVAENGNAFSKYQTTPDYWDAVASCQGIFYQLFGVSIITGAYPPGNWDAWAVGRRRANTGSRDPLEAVFMRFTDSCWSGASWDIYQYAPGGIATRLYGIKMMDGPDGYAVGNQSDLAAIFKFYPIADTWALDFLQPGGSYNPSNFYSVDIINSSKVAWVAGYYTNPDMGNMKWEYISYIDADGRHWIDNNHVIPTNGTNVYHRPIKSIGMGSDTMGWAVGDPEDGSKKSVLYQYPYPNFTLDTFPAARAVRPGYSTTFTATVSSIGGFNTDVSLSFPYSLPAGVGVTANSFTIDRNHVATITVSTSGSTPVGSYCLALRGSATFMSGDVPLSVARDVCLNLYVTDHPVSSVSPNHGPAGTVVTISGDNFGSDPGNRSTSTNHVSWENVWIPNANVLSWSNSQITFRPPDSPNLFSPAKFPLNGHVKVTAGGTDSNGNYTFKMDPWITNLSQTTGASAYTITLTGTSFGNDPGSMLRSTTYEHVSLDGSYVTNLNIVSWSNNSIVFTVPLGSAGGTVTVTSNGFESNAVSLMLGSKEFLPLVIR